MAMNNILPYTGIGSGGGHVRLGWFRLAAATSLPGEPVVFSSGEVAECGDDPAIVNGVVASLPVNGFTGAVLNYPYVSGLNPDRATAAHDSVPVYMSGGDQLWVTNSLLSTGSALTTVPAIADVGATASLDLISGSWGLYQGGSNRIFRIMDVLDATGKSLSVLYAGAGAGVYTIFKQISGF